MLHAAAAAVLSAGLLACWLAGLLACARCRGGDPRVCGVSVRTLDRLQVLGANFSAAFAQLVALLRDTASGSEVLRFLVFRLDFNGYNGMA